MFSWFKKKEKWSLNDPSQLSRFTDTIYIGLEQRLNTPQKLYDFITEDICGAAQGNQIALELVKFSELQEVEYLHALHNDSTMDEDNSALDYMNNQISPILINQLGLERAIKIRCEAVKKIISTYRRKLDSIRLETAFHKYQTSSERHISRRNTDEWIQVIELLGGSIKQPLKAQDLDLIMPPMSHSEHGIFFDIHQDIESYFKQHGTPDRSILMPMLYAWRLAFAGMYAQGLTSKANYDEIDQNFYSNMAVIGQNLTKEEQVQFQEDSLSKALDWISKTYSEIKPITSNLLVASAKNGLSLRNALNDAVNTWEEVDFIETLNLETLNAEFCKMFYTVGGWLPSEDYNFLAQKAYNFLNNEMIHPYTLLLKNN